MSLKHENGDPLAEKQVAPGYERTGDVSSDPENLVVAGPNRLHQDLKGRHMQMIAMQVPRPESSSRC